MYENWLAVVVNIFKYRQSLERLLRLLEVGGGVRHVDIGEVLSVRGADNPDF